MIFCDHCYTLVRILDIYERISTQDTFPEPQCPVCEHGMVWVDEIPSDLLPRVKLRELTDVECYRALCKQGMPDEAACTPDMVHKYMVGATVTDVQAQPVQGTSRSILESITLSSGAKIYLGASNFGATVCRIVR